MSKDNKFQLLSPLFLKYQADFEKNPRSRVFAPLAESYRKLGMTDKSMEILSQGIRFHPTYVMGYLGLAFCYFDLSQFNLAYSTLIPLIETNRDNLRLQKLFSDVCIELGKKEEALETLKYLLFINPRDKEIAEKVSKIEREVENKYKSIHRPIIIPEEAFSKGLPIESESTALFNLDKLDRQNFSKEDGFDDWIAIDLSQDQNTDNIMTRESQGPTQTELAQYDQWDVVKSNQVFELSSKREVDSFEEREFKLDYDHHEFKQEEIVFQRSPEEEHSAPLITHTLVDLYCGQGHIDKALIVLEKILLLNPHDQKTIKKIKEIEALAQPVEHFENYAEAAAETEAVSEEDGRRHLMSLIDEKLGPPIDSYEEPYVPEVKQSARIQKIEERLLIFLKKIQKRALDYQGSV
jgi:tetratricopeptide (TPR) repeat protein